MALPFGANDFVEYWSAYQLLKSGSNPYDPALLLPIQRSVAWGGEQPLMMWNPPWLLLLLAPILELPFLTAARVFVAWNICFTIAAGYFAWRLIRPASWLIIPASFLFFPVWCTLMLGQVAILIAAALALSLWAFESRRDALGGAALAVVTLKPHLAYLVLLVLAWQLLIDRRFLGIAGFAGMLAALIIGTWLFEPNALAWWLESGRTVAASPVQAVQLGWWKTATLGSAVHSLIGNSFTPSNPRLFDTIVAGVTAIALFGWCITRKPQIEWPKLLPPLLALSVLTAPFGWLFDQALLIIAQCILVARITVPTVSNRTRIEIFSCLILLQLALVAFYRSGFAYHHHYVWVSLIFLVIALRANKLLFVEASLR